MVADTNFPDIGIQIFDPRDSIGEPQTLCYPGASSIGEHWNGAFPYAEGGPYRFMHLNIHIRTRLSVQTDDTSYSHPIGADMPKFMRQPSITTHKQDFGNIDNKETSLK